MKKAPVTTEELLTKLESNFQWARSRRKQAQRIALSKKELSRHEAALVADLRQAGFSVHSVWDLVNMQAPYGNAIPVLLTHLRRSYHPRIREGIVRALSIKEAGTSGWEPLLKEYEAQSAEENESLPPEDRGLKDALANALALLADPSRLPDLVRLVDNARHGASRVFLLEALGRLGGTHELSSLTLYATDVVLGSGARRAARKIERRLRLG